MASEPSALRTNSSGSGGGEAAAPPQAGAAGCPAAGHPAADVELDPVVAKALRKQRLLQDKNRRAQARFRERQKVGARDQLHTKCVKESANSSSQVSLLTLFCARWRCCTAKLEIIS
jgi:hypothetical protein